MKVFEGELVQIREFTLVIIFVSEFSLSITNLILLREKMDINDV